jgi:hypothetical protein
MKHDPSYQLRQAIYTAIKDKLVYNKRIYGVDLYDKMQKQEYFVKIGYPSMLVNADYKGGYIFHGSINLEVVNRGYQQSHSAEQEVTNIVDDIGDYLVNTSLPMTGFTLCVGFFVTSYQTIEILEPQMPLEMRKIITFEYQIKQI